MAGRSHRDTPGSPTPATGADPGDARRLERALGRPPNGFERLVWRVIRPLFPPRRRRGAPPASGPAAGSTSLGIDLPTPSRGELRTWFCPGCGARRQGGAAACGACGMVFAEQTVTPVVAVHAGAAGLPSHAASVRAGRRPAGGRMVVVAGIVALSAVVGVVGLAATGTGSPLPAPVQPKLPDLVMAPIADVNPSFTGDLIHALRFGAKIANIGEGEFMLSARRSAVWADDWRVFQRFREPSGSLSELATDAAVIYGNDAHDHWHIQAVEAHRLERRDTGEVITEVVKQGFCFYDTDLYRAELAGAPAEATFLEAGCDGPLATRLSVGLSIGWADDYPWQMMDQRMSVGQVPDGVYRLHEIADPLDWFDESDETNNETWVDIELTTSGTFVHVKVLGRAPED